MPPNIPTIPWRFTLANRGSLRGIPAANQLVRSLVLGLGHYLGLAHPFQGHEEQAEMAPLSNLMNQSKVAKGYGGRDGRLSLLSRGQIEHVFDPANWGKKTYDCFAAYG